MTEQQQWSILTIGSGAKEPFCALSNFALCPNGVTVKGNGPYWTTESLFVGLKYIEKDRFKSDGDIGSGSDMSYSLVYGISLDQAVNKRNFWKRKEMHIGNISIQVINYIS